MAQPLGKSVPIYACAFAVAGATPFLLLPLLTRQLSPAQFGEVTSFLILTAMLANAAGLSAHGFVSVRYFKVPTAEFRGLMTSALAAVVAAHGLAAALVLALYLPLGRALDLPFGTLLLAVAAALFLSMNMVFLALFQASGRPLHYLGARLIQGLIELLLCIALLYLLAPDAGSRMHSYAVAIAASAVFGLHCSLRAKHLGGVGVDTRQLRALAAFGLPMLPHILAGTAIAYQDRVVVSSLLGAENLGFYMAAMQIGMVMIALVEPLNKALAPWLFEQLSRNDSAVRAMIVRNTYRLFAALACVGVVVAMGARLFFDQLVGPGYAAAMPLIPWMVAGFVLQGMYYAVVNYLFYAERTGRLSLVSATTAVAGCAVSYLFTFRWGLEGAAMSFALNNGLLFVGVWWAASRVVAMPWRLGR
jgi:O-antigen/teichoic acid export membrane protein